MTDHSEHIRVDLGNPEVPPYEMMVEIKLPLSLDKDLLVALMDKAAELRQWFLTESEPKPAEAITVTSEPPETELTLEEDNRLQAMLNKDD